MRELFEIYLSFIAYNVKSKSRVIKTGPTIFRKENMLKVHLTYENSCF